MINYLVTGWSRRYGHWHNESIEAKSKAAAIERFTALRPSLTNVKAYALKGD
jgi:hypothetical protein